MSMVHKHLELLGCRVRDKVTALEGVVDSVSFDLYGCIQAGVNPGLGNDGKQLDWRWYDVSRLTVLSETPVMDPPDFVGRNQVSEGRHGPADKAPIG